MKIVAVVVTYNGAKWIDKCFGSLVNSSVPLCILAIDNASTDNTVNLIKQNFPVVEVIETGANLGFGKANNIGFKKALEQNADYVFLLNQDARVDNYAIETLISVAVKNREYGIISPFHFNWEGNRVDHFFLRMVNPDDCPDFLSDNFIKTLNEIYTLKFIHAACWLISKECLIKTGGFDPLFYHYGEDNDYVSRAAIKGFKTGICPAVNVYHYGFFNPSKGMNANKHLEMINNLLELKTPQNNLIGNYLFFFKRRFDLSTSLLLSRQFLKSFRQLISPLYFLKYYNRIRKSRKASLKERAFL